MARSPRTNWKHSLAACATTLGFGCGDGGMSTETESTSAETAVTDNTGDTEDPAPVVVELRPDLCDQPPDAAVIDELVRAAFDDDEPPYGQRNDEQLQRMADEPLRGPFYMVNLIRYREHAQYPDGRETDLSGEEANALYSPVEFLDAIGANVVFSGSVSDTTLGGAGDWEDVAIVEYPCPVALLAMGSHPDFQARIIHKHAGVESSTVMVTHRRPLEDVGAVDTPFPPTTEDPSFEHVQVLQLAEQANYDDGAGEPDRSGDEALGLYAQAVDQVSPSFGLLPRARLEVEGVYIGDGRAWDEVWIDYVPSGVAWEALHQEPGVVAAQHHFDAAVEEAYGLATQPVISMIPGAAEGGDTGGGSIPVTPDGTGTPCQIDADCPGDGVDTCLNPAGTGGFCTREGCGAGDCEEPFACCRDCADAAAELLPFEGSACMPGPLLDQLTQPPLSCTCD